MTTQGKQAFLDATPMQKEVTLKHLTLVLAVLRAQYLSYQTSHWQVVGGTFYGNHLLFERLYKSVQDQVDQLAEKLVGYLGREAVDLLPQMKHMLGCVIRWGAYSCPHKRGIASETELQTVIQEAYDATKAAGTMTLGLDDWLMATANQHEENTYLLQQAATPVPKTAASAAWVMEEVMKEVLNKPIQDIRAALGNKAAWRKLQEKAFNNVSHAPFSSYQELSDEHRRLLDKMEREMTKKMKRLIREKQAALTPDDVHQEAEAEGVKWDNDRAFMDMSERVTGKRHLDDMSEKQLKDVVAEIKKQAKADDVAPTAEGHFFDNPSHREVLEFAHSNAISNIKDVTEEAAPELDISEAKALRETAKAPLTPVEIAKEPGGKELSTLNRLQIKGHEKRMAAWMSELLR
jgi:hypothetical protein